MTRPVAFITGGSQGIGAAIARLAALRGYAVAINYQSDHAAALAVQQGIEAAAGHASLVQGDVGDEVEVERMMALVHATLGPIRVLVNNAGITGPIGEFAQTDPRMVERVFRTNVFGTMNCCRAVIRQFRHTGHSGVIVDVSSTAATTGSAGEYVHYAASKAAIDTFTLGLARELAPEGIRVCGVAPGSTLTGIHARAGEPGRPQRVAPLVPMKRLAMPDEIAEAVLWIMSDAASYVTGSILRCGGGL